ncbi:MAG: hypothetical protein RQ723_07315 [Desulfuromonadales bacterium]|nr:hypothetical protein [Desulfuromonadales bacterium]
MKEMLEVPELDELSTEKSVRGEVARLAEKRLQAATPEERPLIAAALRLLLDRFAAVEPDKL